MLAHKSSSLGQLLANSRQLRSSTSAGSLSEDNAAAGATATTTTAAAIVFSAKEVENKSTRCRVVFPEGGKDRVLPLLATVTSVRPSLDGIGCLRLKPAGMTMNTNTNTNGGATSATNAGANVNANANAAAAAAGSSSHTHTHNAAAGGGGGAWGQGHPTPTPTAVGSTPAVHAGIGSVGVHLQHKFARPDLTPEPVVIVPGALLHKPKLSYRDVIESSTR